MAWRSRGFASTGPAVADRVVSYRAGDMADATTIPLDALRGALIRQYHAGLATLHACIERCPDDVWVDGDDVNPTWRVAYHVLFYTHFYLHRDHESFVPWELHELGIQQFGARKQENGEAFRPYTRDQVLAYWLNVASSVDDAVGAMDLLAPESGFPWYPMSKLEHQLVNIRHLQHHAGQLADRLRQRVGIGTPWSGTGKRQGAS